MGGGTGTGVSADGPQPASNVKTVIEANTARPSIMVPNDEVGRRGVASSTNEADLSSSSTSSWAHRSSFRNTSFRPDQTSVTAHTLMSTKPRGSATSRIVSSVMSVGTFAAFFGQDTQIDARTSSV